MTRYLRVRLDAATAARLDRACLATGRSPSELVRHAIASMAVADDDYMDRRGDAP